MAARKRIDPVSRPADGSRPYDRLKNARPDRHYVAVNPNDELCGVAAYESMGYELERIAPGGVRSAVGRTAKDGDIVSVLGQQIMSRPMVDHEIDFAAGQSRADLIDRRILKDGGIDGDTRDRAYSVGVNRALTSDPFVEIE